MCVYIDDIYIYIYIIVYVLIMYIYNCVYIDCILFAELVNSLILF